MEWEIKKTDFKHGRIYFKQFGAERVKLLISSKHTEIVTVFRKYDIYDKFQNAPSHRAPSRVLHRTGQITPNSPQLFFCLHKNALNI